MSQPHQVVGYHILRFQVQISYLLWATVVAVIFKKSYQGGYEINLLRRFSQITSMGGICREDL